MADAHPAAEPVAGAADDSDVDLEALRAQLARERSETEELEAKLVDKAHKTQTNIQKIQPAIQQKERDPAATEERERRPSRSESYSQVVVDIIPVSPSATGTGAATPPLQEDNYDGFEEDELKTPDDLTQCGEDLNDAIIAQMLQNRYDDDQIYTYIGDILVALNPFRRLPIYGPVTSRQYMGPVDKAAIKPHIFYTANNAYRMMMIDGESQVCVISGESGAGKTECTKLLVRQIIDVSAFGLDNPHSEQNSSTERHLHPVEEKILQINPILEAFGNAQTVMNDNSSRFGKYMELQFTSGGTVKGASLRHYLLEKSRVCFQNVGEHNYHVFAQFLAGADNEIRNYYNLGSYEDYAYLPEWHETQNFNDPDNITKLKAEWEEQQQGMFQVGFSDAEREDASGILAGILLTGNIDYEAGLGGSEESQPTEDTAGALAGAADAFCLDSLELSRVTTTGELNMRGETIVTHYNAEKAEVVRDSMAKAVYSRLFSWLIIRMDAILADDRSLVEDEGGPSQLGSSYAIGVLDIFGFEQFEVNGFDQMLINLANEHLQCYFNRHIFAMEMDEFVKQEIDQSVYGNIKYDDNLTNLQLFSAKPFGIFSLLDEQSKLPKATADTLSESFNKNLGSHASFTTTKTPGLFGVKHYAGTIMYTLDGFLEKNRDNLPDLVVDMLVECTNPLLRFLFADFQDHVEARKSKHSNALSKRKSKATVSGGAGKKGRKGGAGKKSAHRNNKSGHGNYSKRNKAPKKKKVTSAASSFFVSLRQLMFKLDCSTPHFVRCIKPNSAKVPGVFEAAYVLRQMRYNGILATVQMRRKGFPHRPLFTDFIKKFKGLVMDYTADCGNDKAAISSVMQQLAARRSKMYPGKTPVFDAAAAIIGKNKIFLKHWHIEILSDMAYAEQQAALLIQAHVRGMLAKKQYKAMLVRSQDETAQSVTMLAGLSQMSEQMVSAQMALLDEESRRGPEGLGLVKKAKKKPKAKKKRTSDVETEQKRFEKDLAKARKGVIKWWMKSERPRNMHVNKDGGKVRLYFHGLISRHQAEEYLMYASPGTFLVRVSERYHGYAISARLLARVKHFKLCVLPLGNYIMEGVKGEFPTLHDLVKHYSQNTLPSSDNSKRQRDFLLYPLGLVHDLGLGINHSDKVMTSKADFVDDVAQTAANTGKPNTAPDDTVFDVDVDLSQIGSRWLRGLISRADAEDELKARGMVDGRFLLRIKQRTHESVSFALSYTYQGRMYHHMLNRDRDEPWMLDGSIVLVSNRSFWGPVSVVVASLQERKATQLMMSLERDGLALPPSSVVAMTRGTGGGATRGLEVVPNSASAVNNRVVGMTHNQIMNEKNRISLAFGDTATDQQMSPPTSPSNNRRRRSALMDLPGIGVKRSSGSPATSPRTPRRTSKGQLKKGYLQPTPNLPKNKGYQKKGYGGGGSGGRECGNDSAGAADMSPRSYALTGRRRTGVPRFVITQNSTVKDVSLWLVSIGQGRYVPKFEAKKITGEKLFQLSEKKCRKLVKKEDDFVLFKRALRQALAFASTIPADVIPEIPEGDEGSRRMSRSPWDMESGKRQPFRSVHRDNPAYKSPTPHTAEENAALRTMTKQIDGTGTTISATNSTRSHGSGAEA